jgi:hypothetical protein
MSFCGAADRYSDARDMGYPFARPFERSIADTLLPLDNAAGRGFSIVRGWPAARRGGRSPDRLGKARGQLGPVLPARAYRERARAAPLAAHRGAHGQLARGRRVALRLLKRVEPPAEEEDGVVEYGERVGLRHRPAILGALVEAALERGQCRHRRGCHKPRT